MTPVAGCCSLRAYSQPQWLLRWSRSSSSRAVTSERCATGCTFLGGLIRILGIGRLLGISVLGLGPILRIRPQIVLGLLGKNTPWHKPGCSAGICRQFPVSREPSEEQRNTGCSFILGVALEPWSLLCSALCASVLII